MTFYTQEAIIIAFRKKRTNAKSEDRRCHMVSCRKRREGSKGGKKKVASNGGFNNHRNFTLDRC
jgi:hypothetical protein